MFMSTPISRTRSDCCALAANVRFGSQRTLGSRLGYVRFTPESGHCRLGLAMSALCQLLT